MTSDRSAKWGKVMLAAAAGWLISTAAVQAQTLVGDYKLTGDLTNSVTGMGALGSLNTVGVAGNVGFTTATVDGTSRQVLRIDNTLAVASSAAGPVTGDGGVQVNTNGSVTPILYSVVLDLSLDAQIVGKMIDTTNLTNGDSGLYADNGALFLNGTSSGTPGTMPLPSINTFFELTLTYNGTGMTPVTNVYVNGTLALTSSNAAGFATTGTNQLLSLFKADSQTTAITGTGEPVQGLTGDLAEVRVYDGVIAVAPEPGTVSVVLLGGGTLALAAFRRGQRQRRDS